MNRQATRHIVPSQARGYADRSNRERRDSRHPAIASRRVLSRRNQIRVSRAPRVRARAVNLMLARSLFRGSVDRADQAVNAAGERTDGGGGRVEVRGAHRAVAQRHEVTGGVGGKLVAGVFEGSTKKLVIPLAVLG